MPDFAWWAGLEFAKADAGCGYAANTNMFIDMTELLSYQSSYIRPRYSRKPMFTCVNHQPGGERGTAMPSAT